jgi:hypothetical protein
MPSFGVMAKERNSGFMHWSHAGLLDLCWLFLCQSTTLALSWNSQDVLLQHHLVFVCVFSCCFGITGFFLAFILPAAVFLKIEDGKFYSKEKLPAVLLLLFGVAVMITGTVLAILETVDNPGVCEQWSYCMRNGTLSMSVHANGSDNACTSKV